MDLINLFFITTHTVHYKAHATRGLYLLPG